MALYQKIALVACSNGQSEKDKEQMERLIDILQEIGLEVAVSPYIYAE